MYVEDIEAVPVPDIYECKVRKPDTVHVYLGNLPVLKSVENIYKSMQCKMWRFIVYYPSIHVHSQNQRQY